MRQAVKSDQSKINIDLDTSEENSEYVDNPNMITAQNLSTEEQRKILDKFGAEKVSKVLEKLKIQSLNELSKDDLEEFEKELETI